MDGREHRDETHDTSVSENVSLNLTTPVMGDKKETLLRSVLKIATLSATLLSVKNGNVKSHALKMSLVGRTGMSSLVKNLHNLAPKDGA